MALPQLDLASMLRSDPAAQELGIGVLGQQKQQAQADLEQQQIANQWAPQLNQSKIGQEQAQAGALNAQIPGMQAQSQITQNRAKASSATMEQEIEAELANMKGKISDAQLKQIQDAGQAFSQVGAAADLMPGPLIKSFAKEKLGSLWHPEFDQYDGYGLSDQLTQMGEAMNKASSKYQLQQAGLGTKQQTALGVASINEQGKIQAAQIAAAAKGKQFSEEYLAAKAKFGNYPQQSGYYSDLAKKLEVQAVQMEDGPQKESLLAQATDASRMAEEAKQQEIQKAVAAGIEANKAKPNLNSIGIETVTPPTPRGGPQAAQGPSQEDIEFTAKKYGMTVEQVKAKLGIK